MKYLIIAVLLTSCTFVNIDGDNNKLTDSSKEGVVVETTK